ncbi:MAG: hydroxymethylbilane synthase [Bacteroidota bacterium]
MSLSKKIKIGTRGSRLALWQAEYTQQRLAEVGVTSELVIIKTKGDKIQHLSFDKIEGKGFFTKEIEDALLRGDVDMAVHSMKDMPTTPPKGLVITAVSYRENPADWLLIQKTSVDATEDFKLKPNAVVGTSSARRKSQMLHFRPDVGLKDIRGNVPTRIEKLRAGDFDAIILAGAGVERLQLDLSDLEVVKFNVREFVPAPAQGVLAWQTNANDLETRRILRRIHQPTVSRCTNVERKILQLLDGGCQLPLGAYCEQDDRGYYHLWVAKGTEVGEQVKYVRISQSTNHQLAETAIQKLTI